jgi:hypothetical protein
VEGTAKGDSVLLEFGKAEIAGVVIWRGDTQSLDAALIRLERPVEFTRSRCRLARVLSVSSSSPTGWTAFGFPVAYPEGLTISGTLTSMEALSGDVRLLELTCFQGVGPGALNGVSGAAVRINDALVGIVIEAPPKLNQKAIFALPIDAVLTNATACAVLTAEEAALLCPLPPLQLDEVDRAFSQYIATVRRLTTRLPERLTSHMGAMRQPLCCLEDVFVPLAVREVKISEVQPDASSIQEMCSVDPDCRVFSLSEGIREARGTSEPNIFLFGDPGSGKSSILRHVASRAWDDPTSVGLECPYIPMLIRIGDLVDCKGSVEEWLWGGLSRGPDKPHLRPPPDFIDKWHERTGARWLLLLDGFDEVPTRSRSAMLDDLGLVLDSRLSNDRFLCILTSRPAQGKEDKVWFLCNECTVYEVLPLSVDQEKRLVEKWVGGAASEFVDQYRSVRLTASKKTPLMLSLAASVFRAVGRLGATRVALYEALVQASLDDASKKGLERELDPRIWPFSRNILERIAYAMTEEQNSSAPFVTRSCAKYLRESLNMSDEEARVRARDSVKALGRLSGVFYCDDQECYWLHNTVREYLAAYVIARTAQRDSLLEFSTRWKDESWSEVALFLLALLNQSKEREENVGELTEGLARHIIRAEEFQGAVVLFLCAAWAEGAAMPWPLSGELIEFLRSSVVEVGGKKTECESVYADLANSGRSPIDLLGRLSSNPSAASALEEIIRKRELKLWARESACMAALRAGMVEPLRRLVESHAIEGRLAKTVISRLPKPASLPDSPMV